MNKCKLCGHEIEENNLIFTKISKLDIEASNIVKATEGFNKIIIPKGLRLMYLWEAFKLEQENPKLFEEVFSEKSVYYYMAQLNIDKEKNWSRVLYRNRDSSLFARNDDLVDSNADGRVIFVRDLKKHSGKN